MSLLKKASSNARQKSLKHAQDLAGNIIVAMELIKSIELAPETYDDIVRKHSSNTVVSIEDFKLIGVVEIEVDHTGAIVQVKRIKKEENNEK